METAKEVKEQTKSINLADAVFEREGNLYRFLGVSIAELEIDKEPVQILVLGNLAKDEIAQVSKEVLNAKYNVLSPAQVANFYQQQMESLKEQAQTKAEEEK